MNSVYELDLVTIGRLVYRYKWYVMVNFAVFISLSILFLAFITPQYTAKGVLQIHSTPAQVLQQSQNVQNSSLQSTAFIQTEKESIKSVQNFEEIVKRLDLENNPEFSDLLSSYNAQNIAIRRLFDKVKVFVIPKSLSLKIETTSEDPYLAKQITDMLMDVYFESQNAYQKSVVKKAQSFFDERLTQLKKDVTLAQQNLKSFQDKHQYINEKISVKTLEERAETLQTHINNIEEELLKKDTTLTARYRSKSDFEQQLEMQLLTLQQEEKELSKLYAAHHPRYQNLKEKINLLQVQIHQEETQQTNLLKREISALKSQKQFLQNQLFQIQNKLLKQQSLTEEFLQLQYDVQSSEEVYQSYLKRSKEVAQQQDLFFTGARIVSYALLPIKPTFPNPKWVLFIGTVFALCASVLMMLVKENIRTRQ